MVISIRDCDFKYWLYALKDGYQCFEIRLLTWLRGVLRLFEWYGNFECINQRMDKIPVLLVAIMRFNSCWDSCNIVIILLYADVRNIQCVWHMYMSLHANPLQVVCWHIVITCTFIFIIGFPYMLIDEATVWHKYAEGQIALCTASNGVVCAIHSFHFILNKTGVHIILFILLDVLIACYAILLDCDTHSNGTFTKCSWFFLNVAHFYEFHCKSTHIEAMIPCQEMVLVWANLYSNAFVFLLNFNSR